MKKTLVLIRHAHRDNSVRSRDNGLSDKGRLQARWLRKYYSQRFKKDELAWLVSSPKKRCLETIEPIAMYANLAIDVNPDLIEQGDNESRQRFEARVQRYLQDWMQLPQELTLICSHGDWLPCAVFHLLGLQTELKKGSWLELEWSGKAELKCMIPSFKQFYD